MEEAQTIRQSEHDHVEEQEQHDHHVDHVEHVEVSN